MRVHFLHRHVLYTVVILEEGNLSQPRLPRCDMLVSRRALNGRHPATAQCAMGADRKKQWLAEAGLRESMERAFESYGDPPENVTEFNCLGRLLTALDDDWLAVVVSLSNVRKSLGWLLRILIREGAEPKVSGHFFKRCCRRCFCHMGIRRKM